MNREPASRIESTFNERFSHWKIRLPREAVKNRKRGKILKGGWAIWYLFGRDERGEYLDYYSSHRHPGDDHVRIYADGRCVDLPCLSSIRACSKDPEKDAVLEAEHRAENQAIARLLEEKGFGLTGEEPLSVGLNRFLTLNKVDK
jgi:hypothetical protein